MTGTAVDLIWLAPALALLGFVLNGTLALTRPNSKTLVSVIGAGVLLAAFAVAVAVFSAFAGLHAEEPFVFRYWSWIPVGTLQIDFGRPAHVVDRQLYSARETASHAQQEWVDSRKPHEFCCDL